MEAFLHTGIGHPNLLWLLVAAIVSFALGLVVGAKTRSSAAALASLETDRPE